VSSSNSIADELTKLVQLRDAGILTEEEFQAQKAKLLQ
ncbi:SHOCT domain-containing protein, partial [Prevotella copri]|nr:SHOCT domain-containing protein [Segatella copri]